ncbi:MAG: response regulator, partial [Gammaproteobacteria bacterium]|nr:response regulator [Gammaproteobacteria bacterium]
ALKGLVKDGIPLEEQIAMVISDIEMPRMDGYTLTTNIRKDPNLQKIFVLLHTSLSGVFNNSMVDKVGANYFIPKFKPDDLVSAVLSVINKGYIDKKH